MMDEWIDIAAASEFKPNQCVVATVKGMPVAVLHVGGEFFAVLDEGSRGARSLPGGETSSGALICATDGTRVSLSNGEVRFGSPRESIAGFSLRVENGMVQLRGAGRLPTARRSAS